MIEETMAIEKVEAENEKQTKKLKSSPRTRNDFLLLLFCENIAQQLLWHGFFVSPYATTLPARFI